jgi:LysR family transcriptional regulator, nod-box dependent transcriptional activator
MSGYRVASEVMHFHKLDLNLLVALDTLLDERSVSRAAGRLNLSQSALSSSLSRLREYFGDELLVSVGRRMEPTALAVSLAPQVRSILQQIRFTIETRPTFHPETAQRTFRIMTSDYFIEVLLADVVRQLATTASNIRLEVVSSSEEAAAGFVRGDIDLIIAPDIHLVEGHPHLLLFEETYSCVVWTGNVSVSDPLTWQQYEAMSHIAVRLGGGHLALIDRWFAEKAESGAAIERRIDVIASNFGVVPHLVVGTQRVATMQSRHARLYRQLLPLRIIEPPPGFPVIKEAVQWHSHQDSDPGLQWFISLLSSFASFTPPGSNSER